jgi:hypothetical protein
MTKFHSDIGHNHSEFCTKNVAIGLLLGIVSKNPIPENLCPVLISDEEHKQYMDDIDDIDDTEVSIYEILKEFRDDAQFEKDEAVEDNDQIKKKECERRISNVESMIEKAYKYSYEIDMELKNVEDSQLIRDEKEYKKSGETLISILSLDQWAMDKHRFSIFGDDLQSTESENLIEKFHEITTEKYLSSTKVAGSKIHNRTTLDEVATTNLYATLALLVEDFATLAKDYSFKDGNPKCTVIATHIEQLGKIRNNGKIIEGLQHKAISLNVKEAFKRLDIKLGKPTRILN